MNLSVYIFYVGPCTLKFGAGDVEVSSFTLQNHWVTARCEIADKVTTEWHVKNGLVVSWGGRAGKCFFVVTVSGV